MNVTPACQIRHLGLVDYVPVWERMKQFTEQRTAESADEIWLLQHSPVYTLGQAGKREHILNAQDIPVQPIDRGGQVTYHGPGQLIAYLLIDLRRRGLGVRQLVDLIEQALLQVLAAWGIEAELRPRAPGIYVGDAKIGALGLRVRNGRSYHGLSLNVDMDLQPFHGINPCGYAGLASTQVKDLLSDPPAELLQQTEALLARELLARLS